MSITAWNGRTDVIVEWKDTVLAYLEPDGADALAEQLTDCARTARANANVRKWTVIGCYLDGQPTVVGVVAGHIPVEGASGHGVGDAFADHVEADSACGRRRTA